jgi:hypothetical protein
VAPCGHIYCARGAATRARSRRGAAGTRRRSAQLLLWQCADCRLCATTGETHAEQVLEASEGCPLCGAPVGNSTLKVVPVDPSEAVVKARRAALRAARRAARAPPRRAAPRRAAHGFSFSACGRGNAHLCGRA